MTTNLFLQAHHARLMPIVNAWYGVEPAVAVQYYNVLCKHIECVIETGRKLGVPDEQLVLHDLSKFGVDEFPVYARNFYGGGATAEFAYAFNHHLHHNPHHWQHWCFPTPYDDRDDGAMSNSNVVGSALAMPETFVREMVANWVGASMAYNGSPDLTAWLKDHAAKIRLHPDTAKLLSAILYDNFRYEIDADAWGEAYRSE